MDLCLYCNAMQIIAFHWQLAPNRKADCGVCDSLSTGLKNRKEYRHWIRRRRKKSATSWKEWRQVWLGAEGRALCSLGGVEAARQQKRCGIEVSVRTFYRLHHMMGGGGLLNNPVIIKRHGSKEGVRGDHDVTVSIGDWYAGWANGNPHQRSIPILLLTCITCPRRCCDRRELGEARWLPSAYFRLRQNYVCETYPLSSIFSHRF